MIGVWILLGRSSPTVEVESGIDGDDGGGGDCTRTFFGSFLWMFVASIAGAR